MNRSELLINNKLVSNESQTYFIADIAANHDGDFERAKNLIYLAAEAGADAAKFQHFKADTIVSDYGFKSLGLQKSHQSNWKKSVFDVYKDASLDTRWTEELKITCDKAGIAFFTSPYSFELVDHVDPFVPAYKIGSGDITWIEMIEYIAAKNKPYIIASGASTFDEVVKAVNSALKVNRQLCLMQCNTNYTASPDNFKFIQLNVLKSYRAMYPDVILGLSDHTAGHSSVLGAVALGAKMIEKHFTDDVSREGPDHKFSMTPATWREMVDRTRELELALGDGIKRVEENEVETVILQRRSLRVRESFEAGHRIKIEDIEPLRPCPQDCLKPDQINEVIGKVLRVSLQKGSHIKWTDLE